METGGELCPAAGKSHNKPGQDGNIEAGGARPKAVAEEDLVEDKKRGYEISQKLSVSSSSGKPSSGSDHSSTEEDYNSECVHKRKASRSNPSEDTDGSGSAPPEAVWPNNLAGSEDSSEKGWNKQGKHSGEGASLDSNSSPPSRAESQTDPVRKSPHSDKMESEEESLGDASWVYRYVAGQSELDEAAPDHRQMSGGNWSRTSADVPESQMYIDLLRFVANDDHASVKNLMGKLKDSSPSILLQFVILVPPEHKKKKCYLAHASLLHFALACGSVTSAREIITCWPHTLWQECTMLWLTPPAQNASVMDLWRKLAKERKESGLDAEASSTINDLAERLEKLRAIAEERRIGLDPEKQSEMDALFEERVETLAACARPVICPFNGGTVEVHVTFFRKSANFRWSPGTVFQFSLFASGFFLQRELRASVLVGARSFQSLMVSRSAGSEIPMRTPTLNCECLTPLRMRHQGGACEAGQHCFRSTQTAPR